MMFLHGLFTKVREPFSEILCHVSVLFQKREEEEQNKEHVCLTIGNFLSFTIFIFWTLRAEALAMKS